MMAIHVDRITVAAPVLNAITLGAGGSLTVGTTYYYRLIALRYYSAAGRYALSEASAEQSVTPTTGNQTAQLSWAAVADATAYIIQRTTTPGSYPVDEQNSFNLNGQSYAGYPYATTQTSLNDDGGAATNIRFNSYNLDFDSEYPLIEIYGDLISDVATLWEIAGILAGGGYSDLQLLGGSNLAAEADWQEQGIYTVKGCLYIRDCTYQQRCTLLGLPGALVLEDDSVIVNIGHTTTDYSPIFLYLSVPRIPYTNNNNTYAGFYNAHHMITGKSGESNIVSMFIVRPIVYSTLGNYATIANNRQVLFGDFENCEVTFSLMGLGAQDSMQVYSNPNSKYNLFESLKPSGDYHHADGIVNKEYIWLANAHNQVIKRFETRGANRDFFLWSGAQRGSSIIDHTFKAMDQTDNQPYLMNYKIASEVATCILSVTRNFLILDSSGPVQGAVITALNANGLSAFWEDSLATFSTALDASTDPASLTVSDGTKFSEGNYIRCETYGEVLKVTNIAGNVLTVARAQLGTSMREHNTGGCNRVLKMLDSLTTDANGEAGGDEATLQRELYSVSGSGSQANYEDTLITNGYLGRNFYGPYALTITKAGYADYTEAKFLDPEVEKYPLGPQTVEVGLSVVPPPVYVNVPGGEMEITWAAPALLEVAFEAAAITVELSDG